MRRLRGMAVLCWFEAFLVLQRDDEASRGQPRGRLADVPQREDGVSARRRHSPVPRALDAVQRVSASRQRTDNLIERPSEERLELKVDVSSQIALGFSERDPTIVFHGERRENVSLSDNSGERETVRFVEAEELDVAIANEDSADRCAPKLCVELDGSVQRPAVHTVAEIKRRDWRMVWDLLGDHDDFGFGGGINNPTRAELLAENGVERLSWFLRGTRGWVCLMKVFENECQTMVLNLRMIYGFLSFSLW